jgi:hypothetical protein
MEGPTSPWGLRNSITSLTLREHDDDDEEIRAKIKWSNIAMYKFNSICLVHCDYNHQPTPTNANSS